MTRAANSNNEPMIESVPSPDVVHSSLKKRTVRATTWTLIATYGSQAIRLASNLVLTRLLFPEAFGVMAGAMLVLQSLNLFSDFGIQQSLIQDPRGDDRQFNDTAWTLQAIRGVVLWLVGCAIARFLHLASANGWLSQDSALADPMLVQILPIAGLSLIAIGFNATKLIGFRRHMTLGYEAAFQLGQLTVHVIIMVVWAWLYPSVWALVGGLVLSSVLSAIASHLMLPGSRNRFCWNREVLTSLIRFGRFIFISTIFTFIAVNAQRLILGTILPTDQFGIYSIALVLSLVIVTAMDRLNASVLFPLYSQLVRRNDPQGMRLNIGRIRMGLLAIAMPLMWTVAVFGRQIVRMFYDVRYEEAGWMLQLLAVGATITVVTATVRPLLLAHGHAKRHLLSTAAGSTMLLFAMSVGGYLGGVVGVLIGAAVGELIQHLILLGIVHRYGVINAKLDLAVLSLSAVVIGTGWALHGF